MYAIVTMGTRVLLRRRVQLDRHRAPQAPGRGQQHRQAAALGGAQRPQPRGAGDADLAQRLAHLRRRPVQLWSAAPRAPHLAALSSSTGALTTWASHPKYEILSLAATSSALYAGGGGGGGHLPKYNLANGKLLWTASPDGDVASVSIYHSVLLVGGHFNKLGAQVRHHAAALESADRQGRPHLGAGRSTRCSVCGRCSATARTPTSAATSRGSRCGRSAGLCALQGLGIRHHRTDALDASQRAHGGGRDQSAAPCPSVWPGRASDNLSGICRYRVHQQINAGTVASVIPARPTNTSVARAIVPGTRVYHFSVQPTDCSDNTPGFIPGKTVRIVSFQNTNGVDQVQRRRGTGCARPAPPAARSPARPRRTLPPSSRSPVARSPGSRPSRRCAARPASTSTASW